MVASDSERKHKSGSSTDAFADFSFGIMTCSVVFVPVARRRRPASKSWIGSGRTTPPGKFCFGDASVCSAPNAPGCRVECDRKPVRLDSETEPSTGSEAQNNSELSRVHYHRNKCREICPVHGQQ